MVEQLDFTVREQLGLTCYDLDGVVLRAVPAVGTEILTDSWHPLNRLKGVVEERDADGSSGLLRLSEKMYGSLEACDGELRCLGFFNPEALAKLDISL